MRRIEDEKIDRYINELGEEYKELLFNTLIEQSGIVEDLSVSELLRIDNNVKMYLQKYKTNHRDKRLVMFGAVYISIGLFMYLFADILLKFYDDSYLYMSYFIQMVALIIGAMGALLSILPIFNSGRGGRGLRYQKKETNQEKEKLLEYDVIVKWRELEGLCNDLISDNKVLSSKSVIQTLKQFELISEEQENELRIFLKLRNSIAHSGKLNASIDEVKNQIDEVNKIIDKICKKLNIINKG